MALKFVNLPIMIDYIDFINEHPSVLTNTVRELSVDDIYERMEDPEGLGMYIINKIKEQIDYEREF